MLDFVLLLLIFSGTLMVVLAFMALQRRSSPLAASFTVVCMCAAIWDFCFAAEIIAPGLDEKIFWANIQFLGISFLPLAWLALTMHATAQPRQTLRLLPFLGVIPIITNLLIWSDPWHHIFRLHPSINALHVPFPVLVSNYGPYFYAVHAAYGYSLFAVSLAMLIHSWKRTPAIYRRQRLTLMISLVLPLAVDAMYVLGVSPIPSFNFTSIVFSFSGLLLAINVLSLRFLDVLPLAYEAAITEMNVGVIVLDALERVSYLNPAAELITGMENDRAVGVEARRIFRQFDLLWNSADGRAELALAKDGEEHTYQLHRSAITSGRKHLLGQVITLNDISDRARLYRQVERLSITDPLTGGLNRRALTSCGKNEIEQAHRYGRDLSLLMLDIDDFKKINDRRGHAFGDDVLKIIVQTIQGGTRANDLVFRYGGDEFVVLLHETGKMEGVKTAERIGEELRRLSLNDGQEAPQEVRVSLGITSILPEDTLDDMLHRADQAMYQAKAAGKNQIAVA